MGSNRDAKRAQDELVRALERSTARLDALETRVAELERQHVELRALDRGSSSGAPWSAEAETDGAAWVEELPEEPSLPRSDDPELIELDTRLALAPGDPSILARIAGRAELIGELVLAVDALERLAETLPIGRERRRALLHAARLAHSGLGDAERALGLARVVLMDHPADAEAHKLVSRYALP